MNEHGVSEFLEQVSNLVAENVKKANVPLKMCDSSVRPNMLILFSFELSPEDQDYHAYADNLQQEEKFNYYVKLAEELKQDEKQTLYVDYGHMASFNWEDPQFLDKIMTEYARFEPYLKKALT